MKIALAAKWMVACLAGKKVDPFADRSVASTANLMVQSMVERIFAGTTGKKHGQSVASLGQDASYRCIETAGLRYLSAMSRLRWNRKIWLIRI